jgi:hypothetical protein
MVVGTSVVRIFNPVPFGTHALKFRNVGPISRFDHHQAPADRGILYGALSLSGCLVEIFADTGIVSVGTYEVAIITNTRELNLLDLRGNGAMRAGTVAAIAKESNRLISQEWSRYFYDHEFIFGTVDGLIFNNAHNDEAAFALYERANGSLQCGSADTRKLRADVLKDQIQAVAVNTNMIVDSY